MSSTKRVSDLMKVLDKLSSNEIADIANKLFNRLVAQEEKEDASVYNFSPDAVMACKHCGSLDFVKNGKDRHGHTRYICKDCHKTFSKTTHTVVSGTHKDADVWKKYITLMLEGKSIAYCAAQCEICMQTSFDWRHKILNALSQTSFSDNFNGLIEMDEMFVRISYKGNHKNSKNFVMPRESFKRGTDNRFNDNNSKACLLCVVERDKGFYGTIPCRGLLNYRLLGDIFDNRIADESIVMTDGAYQYGHYFKGQSAIEHIALKSSYNGSKPEVKGAFHINNVNALHKRFRAFIDKYNGVSTKYLGNYLSLFLWCENNKHSNKVSEMCKSLCKNGTNITATNLHCLAPVPELAPAA